MIRALINAYRALYTTDSNTLIYCLRMIPIVGKHIPEAVYSKDNKKIFCIFSQIFVLIWNVIKTTVFAGVFFLLPKLIFSRIMAAGALGFQTENSFVYFALIMSAFCGSIIHSEVFNVNKKTYSMLKVVRIRPLTYFRMKMLRRTVIELVSFCAAFSILGMNPIKGFYLSLLIAVSRYAGESFNILVYRMTGKPLSEIKGADVSVMLASLLIAYFIPYLRGCVPNTYDMIFDTLWLVVILVVGSFFAYYAWNYSGYNRIAASLYTLRVLNVEDGHSEQTDNGILHLHGNMAEPEAIDERPVKSGNGYEFLNRLFFIRFRKTIINSIVIRLLIVAAALLTAVIAAQTGHKDIVYKVISYSLPVLVFVMYGLSCADRVCHELFYHCDSMMLRYEYFRDKDTILQNFLIRLRYLMVIDGIPAVALCIAYAIAGRISISEGNTATIICVCIGVILLSVFFTAFNLLMYYILQPFDVEKGKSSRLYTGINLGMYVLCYFCIYIETSSLFFALGTALAAAIMLAAAVTLVAKIAPRTFHL